MSAEERRRPYVAEIGANALVRRADGSVINFGDALYHPDNVAEARAFAAGVSVPTEPGAPDHCPTCGSVDPQRVARGWNVKREPWVRCDDSWHASQPVPAPMLGGLTPEQNDALTFVTAIGNALASRPVPAPEPSARPEDVVRMDGYLAGLHDAEAVLAPEPSARLREELDAEMAGTEDWTEGPDDYLDIRIGLVRRIRAALANEGGS